MTPFQQLILKGIDWSSQDYDQSIDRTLNLDFEYFWSSTGHKTQEDANEYLTFELYDMSWIHNVVFNVYKADIQLGSPIYPPKFIRVHFGF